MADILTPKSNISNEKKNSSEKKIKITKNIDKILYNSNQLENNIDINLKLNKQKKERKGKKNYSVIENKLKLNINTIDNNAKLINKNIDNIKEEVKNEDNEETEGNEMKKINEKNKKEEKEEKKEKEEKLNLKVIQFENRIEELKDFYSKKISNLNSEIKEKENTILSLSNKNNILRHSLEVLTSRVDKILYNSKNNNSLNNFKKMKQSKSSSDISLEHQLKVKEKEIKNQQKLIKILTTDNKNIKSVIERYNMVDLNINLNDKIHEKDVEITNLQKEINNYKMKLEEHNLCSEKIKNLNEQLLEYKKEIELQKVNLKNNYNHYKELKNKIDKYGISGIAKNRNIRKNSADNLNININTFRNTNKLNSNISQNDENDNENENQKILSGNKTDRKEIKKLKFYYNKNNHNKKVTPMKKNVNEISKNEVIINKDGLINLLNSEEIMSIKTLFDGNEEKFSNFVKKINAIEKYIFIKEKEMNQNIKIMKNKMKDKDNLLIKAQNTIKQKTNELVKLNLQIKDLNQIKEVLILKIKELNNTINEEKNNNQILQKEYLEIKNSIFNIDGIIGGNIIKENTEKNKNNQKQDINKNNKDIHYKDINKNNEEYKAGHKMKIEKEMDINKKFFTIQPMIISKDHKDSNIRNDNDKNDNK